MTAKNNRIVLTSKHIAILRAFDDLRGHWMRPRINARSHVWNGHSVVFDLDHQSNPKTSYQDLCQEREFAQMQIWGLIDVLEYPIYELTREAYIYLANH